MSVRARFILIRCFMTDLEFKKRYIEARLTVIERDFSFLNEMQREAVLTTEGPLLLLAGAGSGKTTVLINRIANLVKYGRGSDSEEIPIDVGEAELLMLEAAAKDPAYPEMERAKRLCAVEPCEPWRIAAITFTNKAADELKARLSKMLGGSAEDIWAKTFHSACVRILRRDADKIGFERNFTIYDTSDSASLIKHILKDLDIDEKNLPFRSVLSSISRAKDSFISAEEFYTQAEASGDIRRRQIARAYVLYEERKKKANAFDFDDIIYYTVKLLEGNDDVRGYYQRLFRYVLIDEYQDTSILQYRLAAALAGGHGNICVVGDDDQSIYKFRGATIENILSFEKQYKNARCIKLEQNYRSTANIIGAANAVIRNNQGRKGKELWTDKSGGDSITVYTALNENDEAQYVARAIHDNFERGGMWSDNAVLYRMNAQSNRLEYAFKRLDIPYKIFGGMGFFDRAEIKDVMSYLCVVHNPNDDQRLLRIINNPPRGMGPKTLQTVEELAARDGLSLFTVASRADEYMELISSSTRLRLFANLIFDLREVCERMPLDEFFDYLCERSGYLKALQDKALDEKTRVENTARIENIGELKTNIVTYMQENGEGGLAGFLDESALYTDLDKLDIESDYVPVMTMHSAKGLEFDNVFIIGTEDGIFPSQRVIGFPEEMEEERRLCYVGITRAKKVLTLCCAKQRMLFGKTSYNRPSRFISEIPEELLERSGTAESYSFSDTGASRAASGERGEKFYDINNSKPKEARIPSKKAEPAKTDYAVGDKVRHKAFGSGEIVKMTAMGGDYFVEIAFETATKKLMLRAASQFMTKV